MVRIPRQVLRVIKRNVEHEANEQEGARPLHNLKYPEIDRPLSNAFYERQDYMPSVKYWNGQEIDHCQVDVKDDAEPKGQLPADIGVKQPVIGLHDHDWAAHVLQFDVGLR